MPPEAARMAAPAARAAAPSVTVALMSPAAAAVPAVGLRKPLLQPLRLSLEGAPSPLPRRSPVACFATTLAAAAALVGAGARARVRRPRAPGLIRRARGGQSLADILLAGPELRPQTEKSYEAGAAAGLGAAAARGQAFSSAWGRLLGDPHARAALDLEEELAEVRRQGQLEIEALVEELEARGPTDEDQRVELLRKQQAETRLRMEVRRTRRKASRPVSNHGSTRAASPRVSPSPSQKPSKPPAPWLLVEHKATGRWYYFNEQTRVTSWELPRGAVAAAASAKKAAVGRPPEPAAPWQLVLHTTTSSWYYHDTSTGITAWSLPGVLC